MSKNMFQPLQMRSVLKHLSQATNWHCNTKHLTQQHHSKCINSRKLIRLFDFYWQYTVRPLSKWTGYILLWVCTNPGYQVAHETNCEQRYLLVVRMELASCHHSSTYNFEVTPTFVGNLCIHVVLRVSYTADHSSSTPWKSGATMTSHDTCSAQNIDKRYSLYIHIFHNLFHIPQLFWLTCGSTECIQMCIREVIKAITWKSWKEWPLGRPSHRNKGCNNVNLKIC